MDGGGCGTFQKLLSRTENGKANGGVLRRII